ncbi:hypothetical protein F2P56_030603 [Juglans regia]|uniref:Uncharacterized protein LOC108989726 n=2 Tax=Juglans regia TaxID=51240 RepID=A0A2I4EHV9_JUGRE|nr:uncharacterized protein LOC108989726 [Juglans regia]KAF5450236.1 hypothetical protein F2P56_030603 [Juglans regia]
MRELAEVMTVKCVAKFLSRRGDQDLLDRFFLMAWAFWYRHNKMVIEHIKLEPLQVVNHALNLQCSLNVPRVDPSLKVNKMCCWNAPPCGFFYLNVDGAIFFYIHKAGVGAVVRDEKGNVVLVVNKIEHESDSLLMVEALQAREDSLSPQGNLLQDVKRILKNFDDFQVQHVLRMGNQVAHQLARYAWKVTYVEMCIGSVAMCASQSVWLDQFYL